MNKISELTPSARWFRFCVFVGAVLIIGNTAVAQEWEHHQLTHFTTQMNSAVSTVDSTGGIHVIANAILSFNPLIHRVYYLHASPYGEIMTDTTRLNEGVADEPYPMRLCATSDRQDRVWLLWNDRVGDQPSSVRGVYMAGRNASGEEIFPTTLLGHGGGEGAAVTYRASDETIHLLHALGPGDYNRVSASGDTLIWQHQLPEDRLCHGPRIVIDTYGTPWGAMWCSVNQPADIVLFRFGADTSVDVFYPFGYLTGQRWGLHDFATDSHRNFHFLVGNDSVRLAYCRLDSMLQMQEWRTLVRQGISQGVIQFNNSGECMIAWSTVEAWYVIYWLMKDTTGAWIEPPRFVEDHLGSLGNYLDIIDMPIGGWALTCMADAEGDDRSNVQLYTHGLPPNDVPSVQPRVAASDFLVYPNPFRSAINIELPNRGYRQIAVYDVLGRTIWSQTVPLQARTMTIGGASITDLPSGQYYITLTGHSQQETLPILHLR